MYPPELEIKDTTESNISASYLDLLLSIGRDGQLRTPLYDKRDDFNFHITNFPFLSSNIPSSPAYGVFISQLIRYARACSSYECFILRAMRLSNKLLGQGYVKERLKSSLRKFYGRYGDLTKQYEVPFSRMLHDILDDDHIQWHPPLIGHYTNFWPLLIWTLLPNLTFYLIVQGFHRTYATGAACQQRTLTPSGHLVLSHLGFAFVHQIETTLPNCDAYRIWHSPKFTLPTWRGFNRIYATGVACQQGTLTPPDTWSCPTLGLACVLMLRPISPELVLSPDFWISNTPRYFSFPCLAKDQWDRYFQLLIYFVWPRITDEGPLPEMRIWSILLIKSELKWCIHLSRNLYFNYLVSDTAGGLISPRGPQREHQNFPYLNKLKL